MYCTNNDTTKNLTLPTDLLITPIPTAGQEISNPRGRITLFRQWWWPIPLVVCHDIYMVSSFLGVEDYGTVPTIIQNVTLPADLLITPITADLLITPITILYLITPIPQDRRKGGRMSTGLSRPRYANKNNRLCVVALTSIERGTQFFPLASYFIV